MINSVEAVGRFQKIVFGITMWLLAASIILTIIIFVSDLAGVLRAQGRARGWRGVAAVPCSNDRVVHVLAVAGRCDCQIKLMASSDTPTITPLPNKKFPSKFISAISNCIVILVGDAPSP